MSFLNPSRLPVLVSFCPLLSSLSKLLLFQFFYYFFNGTFPVLEKGKELVSLSDI